MSGSKRVLESRAVWAAALSLAACSSKTHPAELADKVPEADAAGPRHVDAGELGGNNGYVRTATAPGPAAYSAAVARFAPSGDPDGCVDTPIDGGCRRLSCPAARENHPPLVSAGEILVNVLGGGGVVMNPDPDNDYGHQEPGVTWWNGGENVRVTVQGAPGGAEGFEIDLVAPPPDLEPDFPSVDGLGNVSMTWLRPRVSGTWMIVGVRARLRPDLGVVSCPFDAADGGAKIPSSVAGLILDNTTKADQQQVTLDVRSFSFASTASGKTLVSLEGLLYEFNL